MNGTCTNHGRPAIDFVCGEYRCAECRREYDEYMDSLPRRQKTRPVGNWKVDGHGTYIFEVTRQ